MKLAIEQRSRVIQLYGDNDLHFSKKKFEKLKKIAENENIIASKLSFRRLICKWLSTGN